LGTAEKISQASWSRCTLVSSAATAVNTSSDSEAEDMTSRPTKKKRTPVQTPTQDARTGSITSLCVQSMIKTNGCDAEARISTQKYSSSILNASSASQVKDNAGLSFTAKYLVRITWRLFCFVGTQSSLVHFKSSSLCSNLVKYSHQEHKYFDNIGLFLAYLFVVAIFYLAVQHKIILMF
jgi:hypothetical protein